MAAGVSYPDKKEVYDLREESGLENKYIYAEYLARKSFNRRTTFFDIAPKH